jgi:hypothetical protein
MRCNLFSCSTALAVLFAFSHGLFAQNTPTAAAASAPGTLTVRQTMDLAFLRLQHGEPWDLYQRANPSAADGLRKIIADKTLRVHHAAAWRMLGFIGDKSDVARIQRFLDQPPVAVFEEVDQVEMAAALQSLGILYKRNVADSSQLFEKIIDVKYWSSVSFKWSETAERSPIPPRYLMWAVACEGYALANKNDFDAKIEQIVDSINEPSVAEYVRWRVGPIRLKQVREGNLSSKVGVEALELSTGLFNGDMENPGMNVIATVSTSRPVAANARPSQMRNAGATEIAAANVLVAEAQSAYKEIAALALHGEFQALQNRILDNGEPLKPRANWDDYRQSLTRTQAILETADLQNAKPSQSRVEQHHLLQIQKDDSDALAVEIILVAWKLQGSGDAAKKLIPVGSKTVTLSEDGLLVAYMKRIDGKWYWCPFGW